MANFHFIDDPNALQIISAILDLAGPNFSAPYDSDAQPSSAVPRNDETLTQYDVPGGTTIRSTSNPAESPGMGQVISSLLTALGPVISSYGFILPILGIIRGIIEVLCCLMNPWCLVKAVKRLFKKWIPPFISLFPPAAGAVIALSTLKMVLAIVFFILTEIVPTLMLIITNIKVIIDAVQDNNTTRAEAGKQKLIAMAIDLANRLGVTAAAKPLLDIIFLILRLLSGFPCKKKGKKSSEDSGVLGFHGTASYDTSELDSNCCDDNMCPPELMSPPQGRGLLVPKSYGDAPPLWTWQLIPITGGTNIPKLRPYLQDLRSQLNPQLDEEIDEATPVGSQNDAAHFRVRIFGRRGEIVCSDGITDPDAPGNILVPIARINGTRLTMTNVVLTPYMGVVNYCIEPNFDQLVGKNILALGCHPDISEAKDAVSERLGDFELSALEKYPELSNLPVAYTDTTNAVDEALSKVNEVTDPEKPVEDYSLNDVTVIEETRDNLVNTLLGVAETLNETMNSLLSKMSDRVSSALDVDKNVAKAGGVDKAIITVIPRDVTGTPIAKNLPDSADISVNIFTDFGILQNQQRDNTTGIINAELLAPFPGTATITAKVNSDFIMDFDGTNQSISSEQVIFVADAILPKRRRITKPSSSSKTATGTTPEREPGSR